MTIGTSDFLPKDDMKSTQCRPQLFKQQPQVTNLKSDETIVTDAEVQRSLPH